MTGRRGNPVDSPWANGGAENLRNTVARKLRLRPEEDAAIVAVAKRLDVDVSRAVGALALAAAMPPGRHPLRDIIGTILRDGGREALRRELAKVAGVGPVAAERFAAACKLP